MLWWCSSIIGIGGQVLSRRSAGTAKSLFPVCIKSTKNSSLIATASITPGLLSVNTMSSICWFPIWQNVFDPCFCYLIVVAAPLGLVADVVSMSFCLYVTFQWHLNPKISLITAYLGCRNQYAFGCRKEALNYINKLKNGLCSTASLLLIFKIRFSLDIFWSSLTKIII